MSHSLGWIAQLYLLLSCWEGGLQRVSSRPFTFSCIKYECPAAAMTPETSRLQACRTVKVKDINCMQSMWPMSTNTRFLSFFLFHAPSFILLLYCTFEFKPHVMKSTPFPYETYATCEMLRPLWFPLVLVQLSAWLSRSPADPALILPPISFNKLTQAQTWDNSSYSVPSEGDSDNGRCFVSSSMLLWITGWLCWALLCV